LRELLKAHNIFSVVSTLNKVLSHLKRASERNETSTNGFEKEKAIGRGKYGCGSRSRSDNVRKGYTKKGNVWHCR
jgi:hypothetical protein